MAHKYSKFKNKNIPYAKVGRRVFNSLFDAETFCTEHGLDVNLAIEYRDDPELKNNIQTIAQYQKAILQECLDRLKARAEALVQEINRCNADLEKCHPLDRGFLMAVAEYFSIDPVWFLIIWYLSDNISA